MAPSRRQTSSGLPCPAAHRRRARPSAARAPDRPCAARPATIFCGWNCAADRERPLGDVLREVADALHVARDADRRDRLAQIDRQRLAPGDGQDGAAPRPRAAGCRAGCRRRSPLWARRRRARTSAAMDVDQHLLGDAAHLGDAAPQILQFVVVGTDDVFRHGRPPLQQASVSRSGR